VSGAVFDASNEVPTYAVGLGHHVTVNTVAFLSGLCVANRTPKIEGLFYNIHCGPHLPLGFFVVILVDQLGEDVEVKVLAPVVIHGYASTKTGTME
jgi:hypothetical protein